jgi:hypothetical protein
VKTDTIEGSIPILFYFQLVSYQVDLHGNGILWKDFLNKMKAPICYENNTVEFNGKHFSFAKTLINVSQMGKK